MSARARSRALTLALAAVPGLFLAVCFAWPVVEVLRLGLWPESGPDLAAVRDVVTAPVTRRVVWFTIWQAVASTVLTVALGVPAAWLIARIAFPGRRIYRAALVVPFVLPTVVVGTAFVALLGRDGPVAPVLEALGVEADLRRGVPAILAAHVFFNVAVVARTVGAAWSALDPAAEQAARSLGASPLRAWWLVVVPELRAAVAASAAIVFLFCFTSFGVIQVLGGFGVATIEVEIHRATTQMLDLRTASVLAVVQGVAVVSALGLHGWVGARRSRPADVAVAPALHRPRGVEALVAAAVVTVTGVLVAAPISTLAWRSFDTAGGPGLGFYRALGSVGRGSIAFVPPLEAVGNSLRIGAVAASIATVAGLCAAVAVARTSGRVRAGLDRALMLPLGTSAVTLGLGFLVAFDGPPLAWRASPALVPLAQAVVALPFVLRTVLPAVEGVPELLRDAARSLGAGPSRVWWEVDARLLRRPVAVAAGFAFAVSMGEFGATVFIARADVPTIPVAIFRVLSQPGAVNVGQAMALSTILMVVTTAVMLVVDRVGDARLAGF